MSLRDERLTVTASELRFPFGMTTTGRPRKLSGDGLANSDSARGQKAFAGRASSYCPEIQTVTGRENRSAAFRRGASAFHRRLPFVPSEAAQRPALVIVPVPAGQVVSVLVMAPMDLNSNRQRRQGRQRHGYASWNGT